jgi:tetratricopeptide (TPR) repeat protein
MRPGQDPPPPGQKLAALGRGMLLLAAVWLGVASAHASPPLPAPRSPSAPAPVSRSPPPRTPVPWSPPAHWSPPSPVHLPVPRSSGPRSSTPLSVPWPGAGGPTRDECADRNKSTRKCAEQTEVHAQRLISDALALFHAGKYAAATPLAQRDALRVGKVEAAIPLAQHALNLLEGVLGPDHPRVATALYSLAELHREKGDYDGAELLLRRARAIYENESALDPNRDRGTSLHDRARMYVATGEHGRADLALLERALDVAENSPMGDPQDLTAVLNDRAWLYERKGEYGPAERLYHRALASSWREDDRHDVATVLNNLARMYRTKGEYGRAEPLFLRALSIQEKALGEDHPDVATVLDNLAELYRAKGEYGRAEPLFLRALAMDVDRGGLGPKSCAAHEEISSRARARRASSRTCPGRG